MDVPVDVRQLEERATAGLLRRAQHPTADLWIYNYTERCAYEGAWDDYTRACRGLILGGDDRPSSTEDAE